MALINCVRHLKVTRWKWKWMTCNRCFTNLYLKQIGKLARWGMCLNHDFFPLIVIFSFISRRSKTVTIFIFTKHGKASLNLCEHHQNTYCSPTRTSSPNWSTMKVIPEPMSMRLKRTSCNHEKFMGDMLHYTYQGNIVTGIRYNG